MWSSEWMALYCKEIQPVHSKGDQSWVFFGRTGAKAEIPILWPPHVKSWLIGKDSDAGRDWGQEEKGTTEDEMAGWHHQLNGHEFEWTPGVGDGQGGLACCDSWGRKESNTTEQLNWTELADAGKSGRRSLDLKELQRAEERDPIIIACWETDCCGSQTGGIQCLLRWLGGIPKEGASSQSSCICWPMLLTDID